MAFKAKVYNTLDDAAKAGEFFAVNLSDRKNTQPKGNVIFSINVADEDVTVVLPPTWAAIDLLQYAPQESLKGSPQLRQQLRSGLIALIHKSSSDEMRKLPSYRAEMERVGKIISNFSSDNAVGYEDGEIELNVGSPEGPSIVDLDQQAASSGEPAGTTVEMQELMDYNLQGQNTELVNLATKMFPKFTLEQFNALQNQIGNKSSLLALMVADAVGFLSDGDAVVVEKLPSYEEWFTTRDSL